MSELRITMLGKFSIQKDSQQIDDSSNRMRKVWLLLAYLIYSRTNRVTQDHLLQLLQSSREESAADPTGRIKAMLYRARTLLDQLSDGTGHELLLFKNGCYAWNPDIPITVDAEEFERLCSDADRQTQEDTRLDLLRQALALYAGDFLPKLSSEPWVIPISAYYHQMYLSAVHRTLELLEQRSLWSEASQLCLRALSVEPYSETLYQHLMRCRIATADREGALRSYEEMSELLFSNFGVMPCDESRQLYREASRETGGWSARPRRNAARYAEGVRRRPGCAVLRI